MRVLIMIFAATLSATAYAQTLDQRAFFGLLSVKASDPITDHPQCVAYWTAIDQSGLELDGTNVLSWTDRKSGIVAAATNVAMRPYLWPTLKDGRGGVYFPAGKAIDFPSNVLSSTNSTTIIVYWKTNSTAGGFGLGRSTSTAGTYGPTASSDNRHYFHPGVDSGVFTSLIAGRTGLVVIAGTHYGGAATTNTVKLWTNNVPVPGSISGPQASGGTSYDRIGGRKEYLGQGTVVMAIAHFQPQLSEPDREELTKYLENEWGYYE